MNEDCKVFISGPMTGKPDLNREAFADVASKLRKHGFAVTNPHELPEPEGLNGDQEHDWRLYLARNVRELLLGGYTHVVVLDGWKESRGSMIEVSCACQTDLKVAPASAAILLFEMMDEFSKTEGKEK